METLDLQDKQTLMEARHRKELAAKDGELQDAYHTITFLQLAIKYKLQEGDTINADGSIVRKIEQRIEDNASS